MTIIRNETKQAWLQSLYQYVDSIHRRYEEPFRFDCCEYCQMHEAHHSEMRNVRGFIIRDFDAAGEKLLSIFADLMT